MSRKRDEEMNETQGAISFPPASNSVSKRPLFSAQNHIIPICLPHYVINRFKYLYYGYHIIPNETNVTTEICCR